MGQSTSSREGQSAPNLAVHQRRLRRARTIARWLDDRFLDPIIGFIVPGGDLLTAAMGLYLVYAAARAGVGRATVARMLMNLALDTGVGAIPLLGDLFDAAFKANRRNLTLLEAQLGTARTSKGELLILVAAALAFLAALALPVVVTVWLVTRGWSWLTGGAAG